jgi:probable phosphoglycerate mutase
MTKLYLIRHAEAEGNLYRRIHGQYNSLVTENGYRQIEALGDRFSSMPLDAVYSSDLFRTMTTAKTIAGPKGLPLVTRPELREINMGDWEDKTWGEMDLKNHAAMKLFVSSSPQWGVAGGETFAQLRKRASGALLRIAQDHPDQSVAVVTHGTAIRYARAAFQGLPLEESRNLGHSDNTAVTLLEVSGEKVIDVFGDDNSHLAPEISTLARQGWWRQATGTSPDENLWYEPLDLSQMAHRGLYYASRREAWVDLGRDLSWFERQHYMEKAEASSRENPQYLLSVLRKNTIVGLLQLDPEEGKEEDVGYISFFYMLPEFRGSGLGVQLMGQAISTYRPMGRTKLRLSCGEDNPGAMAFYQRYGFRKIGERQESFGTLYTLEKYIGY